MMTGSHFDDASGALASAHKALSDLLASYIRSTTVAGPTSSANYSIDGRLKRQVQLLEIVRSELQDMGDHIRASLRSDVSHIPPNPPLR